MDKNFDNKIVIFFLSPPDKELNQLSSPPSLPLTGERKSGGNWGTSKRAPAGWVPAESLLTSYPPDLFTGATLDPCATELMPSWL